MLCNPDRLCQETSSHFPIATGDFNSCRNMKVKMIMPINSKLQPPPPFLANLWHLTTLFARGVGNLTFVSAGWGKLYRTWKASNDSFWCRRRLLTDKFDDWVGHLNTLLARGTGIWTIQSSQVQVKWGSILSGQCNNLQRIKPTLNENIGTEKLSLFWPARLHSISKNFTDCIFRTLY